MANSTLNDPKVIMERDRLLDEAYYAAMKLRGVLSFAKQGYEAFQKLGEDDTENFFLACHFLAETVCTNFREANSRGYVEVKNV